MSMENRHDLQYVAKLIVPSLIYQLIIVLSYYNVSVDTFSTKIRLFPLNEEECSLLSLVSLTLNKLC